MAAIYSATALAEPMPVGVPGNWSLMFDDEFNSAGLNKSVWTPEWQQNETMSGQCTSPALVQQPGNGYLYLQVRAQSSTCGGISVSDTGSLVESNPADGSGHAGFLYSYGYVEWRVYIVGWGGEEQGCPRGGCIPDWPALWSFPENRETEIDTMEGLKGEACYHFWRHLEPAYQKGGCAVGSYAGWHTYGVDWEPGVLKYYYDGIKVWEYTSSDIKSTPQYLIMNEVPPGSYGGHLVVPDEILVDYVRVWQHLPHVFSQTPRSITRETAELAAQVEPAGFETSYVFDYGTSPSYGSVSSGGHLPAEEKWSNVYMPVSGLKSCTTYDFRVVAKNAYGEAFEPNQELGTDCRPPSVFPEPVAEVQRTSVKLEGQVYPNGIPTAYWFEYGNAGGFESRTSATQVGGDQAWHWESNTVPLKSCTEPSPYRGGKRRF